jgi:hypothetical protein
LVPSTQTKSEDATMLQQQEVVESYTYTEHSFENSETMISYESIFKDGIREALK